jgi:hypothetical protein
MKIHCTLLVSLLGVMLCSGGQAYRLVLVYHDRTRTQFCVCHRARNTLKGIEAKIQASAAKYHAAHTALKILGRSLGTVGWEGTLQVLKDEHIRGLSTGEDGKSEGRRTVSWIWQTIGVSGNENADLQECK